MRAAAILNNPLVTLYNEGPNDDLEALAKRFGVAEVAARIANAIPESATSDPEAWLTTHAVYWQKAGLFLGLCLGFRIAAGLGGKE